MHAPYLVGHTRRLSLLIVVPVPLPFTEMVVSRTEGQRPNGGIGLTVT